MLTYGREQRCKINERNCAENLYCIKKKCKIKMNYVGSYKGLK